MQSVARFELQHLFQTTLTALSLKELQGLLAGKNCPVIADRKVRSLYPDLFKFNPENLLLLTAGEKHKNRNVVTRIHRFLVDCNATRDTEVIVLGGGTITDTAAYAISTFKRGCQLTLIPTTLLSMVDAALGGKTAINQNGTKNLLGTFYPADNIIIVPEFLNTLSKQEELNGLAEMLKLRCIRPDLPDPLSISSFADNPELIMTYAKAKLEICALDPLDRAERRLLNLGHTFAHVLESLSDYQFSHGDAVAWGVAVAARLSLSLDFINRQAMNHIIEPFSKAGFNLELEPSVLKEFLTAFPKLAAQDKKATQKGLTLILFNAPLKVEVIEISIDPEFLKLLSDCV